MAGCNTARARGMVPCSRRQSTPCRPDAWAGSCPTSGTADTGATTRPARTCRARACRGRRRSRQSARAAACCCSNPPAIAICSKASVSTAAPTTRRRLTCISAGKQSERCARQDRAWTGVAGGMRWKFGLALVMLGWRPGMAPMLPFKERRPLGVANEWTQPPRRLHARTPACALPMQGRTGVPAGAEPEARHPALP